ncbi:hypothetical protein HYE82_13220 [Streptomyces sp. BR123]|uniref:hypothetical protein n=1 Tax=Streptomyces sp. BR123 TaxID=2749828 RepID=UPI0015C4123E|nr:hypothetical protein [Streptomyces sp. BR123]NXY95328.1 hypothetical protein [Streptomyces sp. BR123]
MPRSRTTHTVAALTACLGALAYTVSKVDLATDGELGMPGFPAPAEAYGAVADVATAQLANAGLGLLMAVVALLLLRLPRTRLIRWPALGASWAGIAMVGAGVLGFGARAAGLAPGLGPTPPHLPTALAALLVGAVWAAAWAVAAVCAVRTGQRTATGATGAPTAPTKGSGTAARRKA